MTTHTQQVALTTSPTSFNFAIDKANHTPIAYSLYTNNSADTILNFESSQMTNGRFVGAGFARGLNASHTNTIGCIILWVAN